MSGKKRFTASVMAIAIYFLCTLYATASDQLPIADAHVHYSHDSVEFTPPERVIELMRNANLKFALVSSSDDNGTQLLSELAPGLIVPGLRPYRRRGELNTWFKDAGALAYVEKLLATNRYATIGEFHLYGSDADLEIPRRIVELAVEHNLVLHAHSDAEAVTRLLAQNDSVKVLWAHAGFDAPEEVSAMLDKHERLWADLAFRSEVGSGGQLSDDWSALFTKHPDRLMLGTDTYTPERMYYLPEHAAGARVWLQSLPGDLAEKIAWKNAYKLLMPHWQKNKTAGLPSQRTTESLAAGKCKELSTPGVYRVNEDPVILIEPAAPIAVSEQFSAILTICNRALEQTLPNTKFKLDAIMPAHGHGMNYTPQYTMLAETNSVLEVQVDGLMLHMPGNWQWRVELRSGDTKSSFTQDFSLQ